ncbi:UPF0758 domain-containing protein, partial [Pseudomonas syringae group genomosp. 7]
MPAADRPRERLLKQGAGRLSDAALLGMVFRTGVAGESGVAVGRGRWV